MIIRYGIGNSHWRGYYKFTASEGTRYWEQLKIEPWVPFTEDEIKLLIVKARAAFDAVGIA